MIVELSPGDELVIQFRDTDGEFHIHFDSKLHPDAIVVEETNGCPDVKERTGVIYKETF